MLSISQITGDNNEFELWSDIWLEHQKGREIVIRSHDCRFYKSKCLNNEYSCGFACHSGEKIVGFCGINTKSAVVKNKLYKIAEIWDFIIYDEYKKSGYAKEFYILLCKEILAEYDGVFFQPYNRNALIIWKFILNNYKTQILNNWCLDLRNNNLRKAGNILIKRVDDFPLFVENMLKENSECLNTYVKTTEFLRWRYVLSYEKYMICIIYCDKREIGYFAYRTVDVENYKGAEITDICVGYKEIKKHVNGIFNAMNNFFIEDKMNFFALKTSLNNEINEFLQSSDFIKQVENKTVMYTGCEGTEFGDISDNYILMGEEWDIPRNIEFFKKFLLNKEN